MERLNQILAAMEDAMREGARLMLDARDILAETKSGKRDVVTEYDRRVQALLTARLAEAVPGAGFFCEETEAHSRPDAARLFIIDPIDGTMNFVHGFHHSCLSVAYAEHGVTLAGAVYNPYADEMFTAVSGAGARLNGREIHVADAPLSESVICFGTAPYNPELTDQTFAAARALYGVGLDVRREGSAALDLCSVAAGRAGLFLELQVSLWDYAAGDLIVREAGGTCCRADGTPFPADGGKTSIAAGGEAAMRAYLEMKLV